jgi:hypothetical protein
VEDDRVPITQITGRRAFWPEWLHGRQLFVNLRNYRRRPKAFDRYSINSFECRPDSLLTTKKSPPGMHCFYRRLKELLCNERRNERTQDYNGDKNRVLLNPYIAISLIKLNRNSVSREPDPGTSALVPSQGSRGLLEPSRPNAARSHEFYPQCLQSQ